MKFCAGIRFHRPAFWLFGVVAIAFFSRTLGKSDFGYRIHDIDVKLSSKFPPAIAFDLLESKSSYQGVQDGPFTPLTVGYPDLGPVQLEELTFGSIEKIEKIPQVIRSRLNKSKEFNIEGIDFTEEERARLVKARHERGLDIDDFVPSSTESAELKRPPAGLIKGEIEFVRDGSLALTDQHYIDVRRFEEGRPKEVGQVDLNSGTFLIDLASTKGVIVSRLRNQGGGIDGEGTVLVTDLLKNNRPKIIIKRTQSREAVRASSAYGGVKSRVDSVVALAAKGLSKSPEESSFDLNLLDRSSDFVAEAISKNHRSTLSLVNMYGGAELVLLPERMIDGLSEILSEQKIFLDLDRGDSLIWGTVVHKGKPVEGATVIANQGRSAYFGGFYLPDQTRSKTSENGMFAIAVEHPGWNDLYIELKDGRAIHINALTYPGKVTQVSAEIPENSVDVTFRSFDAFTGMPVRTRLEVQQLIETVDTGEEGTISATLPSTRSLSFILTEPQGAYLPTRLSYTTIMDYIHVPLFTFAWFNSFRGLLKLSDNIKTGAVVGFVQGDDFYVVIPNRDRASSVIYFDQQGQSIDHGLAGGGFIAFDLDEHDANLVLVSQRTQREIVRTIRPENKRVHVISAAFE